MREKYIFAIRVLATLLAAELVLVGSFFVTRAQISQEIIPTISIAYNTTPGPAFNLQPTSDPSTLADSDLFERQTGEALMDQETLQTTPSPESTAEAYPAPIETLTEQPLIEATPSEVSPPPNDFEPLPDAPWDEWNGGEPDDDPPPEDNQDPTPLPSPNPTLPNQPTSTLQSNNPISPPKASPTIPPAPNSGLVSIHVETAPKLDGSINDESWQNAPALTVLTQRGVNASATQVTLKSVYNGKRIYFLLTWADPTHSQLYQPWEKQKDGSWKKILGASNKGGDENDFAEDKIAIMWPASKNLDDFAVQGCAIACHSGENPQTKAFGNTYLPKRDQIADLWVWKSVRNVGQMDDLYLDSTRYADDQRAAGRKSDPRDDGGYRNNGGSDAPEFMLSQGSKDGLPGFILDSDKQKLANDLFKPGERVPSFITTPFSGDRGNISAAWRYQDGQWILEISRKLETGSEFDVQFSDLDHVYNFAIATFDNTQVRHAAQDGVIELRFQK